ncbi:MAG: DUF1329 domain-containing protein [Candidatus Binatia bacterium]|nr:DUF1329 domain-containing protein [Candidatus Binatia bacterium]
MRSTILLLVAYVCTLHASPAGADTHRPSRDEQIRAVFYPYRQGPVRVEGIVPGMTIDATNAHVAAPVLPAELLTHLQAGDFAITVQDTTDMPLRDEYIQATVAHSAHVELGDGELQHYVAGLPFPLLDPNDPRAGEKAAWNHRYRDRGDTVQFWPSTEHRTSNGTVERADRLYIALFFGTHRPQPERNLPQWEQEGVYSKTYVRTLAPSDVEGNQTLSYSFTNDTLSEVVWLYDVRTRRTRKLVDNPYQAGGGGELLMEDRSGFAGYIHAYEWRYLGEQVLLVPGPIQAPESRWGGRGNWYPVDPWELRRVVVVEARPKGSHPMYSRRVLYIDLQTWATLCAFAYDLAGNHKRTFLMTYFHPQFNPWQNPVWTPQIASQTSIDYQRQRASIFQTHRALTNHPLNPHRFSVAGLMLYGK